MKDTLQLRLCRLLYLAVVAAAVTFGHSAFATNEPDKPIFMDVRLMGADLIDEMVYSWTQAPPLSGERTRLVLADVSAPVGLDDRFNVMVENRLYELLQQNPNVPADLAHCGPCTRFIAKSDRQGTVLSRGIDQPEVLAQLLKDMPERKGLSLDFEAEGRDLVLRAQIFDLTPAQKVLWARTYSTSMGARRVLRDTSPLISLDAAREQQRQILGGHDPIEITTRIVIREFNNNSDSTGVAASPIPFVEQSFEAVPLPRRNLRAGVTLGFTSLQDSLSAYSVGGHVMGLLFRDTPSLVNPDLYWVFGANYIRMRGPGALPFAQNQPDLNTLRGITAEPTASLVAYRLGLEAHIKNRLGMLAFIENIPILKGDSAIQQKSFIGIPYHAWGWGVVIRW